MRRMRKAVRRRMQNNLTSQGSPPAAAQQVGVSSGDRWLMS